MCGILFSSKKIKELENIIKYLKKRGPDHTEHKIINNYNFIHVLLSMTGENYTIQPFVYDDIVIIFNGEIYNFKEFGDFNSDGECIIESYKKYGDQFIRHLDGEFALLLVDFSKDVLYYSTDVFSIKPLWFAQDGDDIGICSYESSLKLLEFKNIKQVDANTTIKMKLSTREILLKQTVYDFDLNQHKTSFDDWNKAFENAIKKRTSGIKHGIFIGLSGGYDSGLISCVLNKLDIDYTAYTILGSEDIDLIKKRHKLIKCNKHILDISQNDFLKNNNILNELCESYYLDIDNGESCLHKILTNELLQFKNEYDKIILEYRKYSAVPNTINDFNSYNEYNKFHHDRLILKKNYLIPSKNKYLNKKNQLEKLEEKIKYRKTSQNVTDDNGAIGMSYICSLAKQDKQLIYLSGSGADEIISDYGFNKVKHYGHSTIGGYFPKDLKSVFPWKNFFGNTQRAYLMKEETVSGTWGIEGRYPFLDKYVVQEFLWLSNELKNKYYKSVIHNYFVKNNYPFELNQKVGFNCGFKGKDSNFIKKDANNLNIDKTPVGIAKQNRKDLIVSFDEKDNLKLFAAGTCRLRNLKLLNLTNLLFDFNNLNKIHNIYHLYNILKYNKKNILARSNFKFELSKLNNFDILILEQCSNKIFFDINNIFYTQDEIVNQDYYFINNNDVYIKKDSFIDNENLLKYLKIFNQKDIKIINKDEFIEMSYNDKSDEITSKTLLSTFRFILYYNLEFDKVENDQKFTINCKITLSSKCNNLYLKYYNGKEYIKTDFKITNDVTNLDFNIEVLDSTCYSKVGIGFYFKDDIEDSFECKIYKFKCVINPNNLNYHDNHDELPNIIFKKTLSNDIIEKAIVDIHNLINKKIILLPHMINNNEIITRKKNKEFLLSLDSKYNFIHTLDINITDKMYLLDDLHLSENGFKYLNEKINDLLKNLP